MKQLFSLTIVCCVLGTASADWPQFRGPDGQGHSNDTRVPSSWSESSHIQWKAPVPGFGWSSPVTRGNQIWLTSSDKKGNSLRAVCLDKKTGKLLHNVEVLTTTKPGRRHQLNGFASPTPVLDDQHAYVHFGPRGTVCLNKAGKVVWRNTEFEYNAFQGAASSPILYKNLLILTCDGTDKQFIAALDKRNGKVVWKQKRAHLERAAEKDKKRGFQISKMAYSTPLVQKINGVDQLVSNGADHVAAYDLKSGKEIWWMPYNGFSIVCRPSYGNGLFYVVGSVRQDSFCVFAIKPGQGKIPESNVAWQRSKGIAHVPSPLLVGKELYLVDNSGVAACVDAVTGKQHWRKRLGGNYDASPVEISGRIYYFNRNGQTTVLAASKKFKVLAKNKLKGVFKASPAVDDGSLFVRSDTHLYRIGN